MAACQESKTRKCIYNLQLTRILTQQISTTIAISSARLALWLVDPYIDFGPWLGESQFSSFMLASAGHAEVEPIELRHKTPPCQGTTRRFCLLADDNFPSAP